MMAKGVNFYSEAIDGGKVDKGCRDGLMKYLHLLEGKKVKITVTEISRIRSLNQNAYYWTVVVPAVKDALEEHGNIMDSEDVHNFLRENVAGLTKYIKMPNGAFKQVLISSSRLEVKEFEEYTEKVRAWAADPIDGLGIIIPLPNEHLQYQGDYND